MWINRRTAGLGDGAFLFVCSGTWAWTAGCDRGSLGGSSHLNCDIRVRYVSVRACNQELHGHSERGGGILQVKSSGDQAQANSVGIAGSWIGEVFDASP